MKRAMPIAVAFTVMAAVPAHAQPQTDGTQVRVNTYTTGIQWWPRLALQPGGQVLAVWESREQDGSGSGIYASRVVNGTAGPEFRVNVTTAGWQRDGTPAVAPDGSFVVVWTSEDQDGGGDGVFSRRFASDGSASGPERQVNSGTAGDQRGPSVAAAGDGTFLVVWQGPGGSDGTTDGIVARRLSAAGAPLGPEVRVNAYTTGAQILPQAAALPAGGWVVAWSSYRQDGSDWGAYARRLDASGLPVGAEFRVHTATTGSQVLPAVAAGAADGSFVIAWAHHTPGMFDATVKARLFAGDGTARGTELVVPSVSSASVSWPSVAMDATGSFVVAWSASDDLEPEQDRDVFARRFDGDGVARGAQFTVNAHATGGIQSHAVVVGDAAGNFAVGWDGAFAFSDPDGAFVQRYGWLVPAALEADAAATDASDGNGVMEPGERVLVAPSWANPGIEWRSGVLSHMARFTGPAPGLYEIVWPDADYDRIEAGETAHCGLCPELRVGGARPATHWDAFAEERQFEHFGQRTPWRLHIGDSFADVPRSSPFYRFVETVLHHGVTAGCAADSYCPASPTTRAQMAPLVLAAREGAAYRPPACATPLFADVPAWSPFCPWVEELARRGVATGCGGGLYCPDAATTRAQMAVFVLRTLDPALQPPLCTAPMFADVPASSPFCRWVEELARRGVVAGCGGGLYCPDAAVTRAQMALLLTATFGLSLYGP